MLAALAGEEDGYGEDGGEVSDSEKTSSKKQKSTYHCCSNPFCHLFFVRFFSSFDFSHTSLYVCDPHSTLRCAEAAKEKKDKKVVPILDTNQPSIASSLLKAKAQAASAQASAAKSTATKVGERTATRCV